MSLPLAYHPAVRAEIDEAYGWYERQRPGLGEEFLVVLRDYLDRIRLNPEMYGLVYRDVRAVPLRRFPYIVYYRAMPDRVIVMAVQHGKRHPRRWRSRR